VTGELAILNQHSPVVTKVSCHIVIVTWNGIEPVLLIGDCH